MGVYLIVFNLKDEGRLKDMEKAVKLLSDNNSWARFSDSAWFIRAESSANSLRSKLRSIMADGDEVLVVNITDASMSWALTRPEVGGWLKSLLD